jgi:hypothetical protein
MLLLWCLTKGLFLHVECVLPVIINITSKYVRALQLGLDEKLASSLDSLVNGSARTRLVYIFN